MNKEKIEKAMKVVFNETCKECYFPKKRKCTNCIKENGKKIKDYIQHLEQKETILDKVTDKLKEDIKEIKHNMQVILLKVEDELTVEDSLALENQKRRLKEKEKYLKIIEGEENG